MWMSEGLSETEANGEVLAGGGAVTLWNPNYFYEIRLICPARR